MFGRGNPAFVAFDVRALGGHDLRERPLIERKRLLQRLVPRGSSCSSAPTRAYSTRWA